jgi:hypothetical protein
MNETEIRSKFDFTDILGESNSLRRDTHPAAVVIPACSDSV